jgi:hypothetical protein
METNNKYIDYVWLHKRICELENQVARLLIIIREIRPLLIKDQ